MKILARILALFLIMPVVELALLVQVDKLIGFWPTVGLILFTGLLGGYLAKREGLAVWSRLNQRMGSGNIPDKEIIDGVIILCAGALLITPGVLTDVIGFLGLIPVSRAVIRKIILKRVEKAMKRSTFETIGLGGAWAGDPMMGGSHGTSVHGAGSYDQDTNGSEAYSEEPPVVGGTGRQMPRHADEFREPRSGADER